MDSSGVQIMNGKAKFIVVPYNVAELDPKNLEKALIEKLACYRITRTIQKTAKINGSLRSVRKRKTNLVFSQILGLRNGQGFLHTHLQIFFVICSDWTGLL